MTSKERAALRARANSLEPIIQIGKEGISDNLISQIDDALDARELIKIRVHLETAPKTPKELSYELARALDAQIVQVIGGILVVYREIDEEKAAAKKAARGSKTEKAAAKKRVKIKGQRQRQREREAKNPYAVYDRPKFRGK